ncbi:MAG: CCA tRNA nucleotidyltransferase [Clostridia bacterium]|nr:CCA tRNA nucleotidyltransferase [Clostridia bacterium]
MYIPEDVNLILTELKNKGYNAYLVGGCVRDAIMGNIPNDYDITTSALPNEIQKVFENRKTLDVGIKHGTITVFTDAGRQVEVTTYRTDGEYKDNRHPENVTFVNNIEADLSRRDFTVNALAYNHQDGFVDIFGGKQDIENKIIRCVGDPDTRFNEDALRILRGLRFASTLNFNIENNTAESIKNNAELLQNVSVERLFIELKKMLVGENFANISKEFSQVMIIVLPELLQSAGDVNLSFERVSAFKNDFINQFALLFCNGNDNDVVLAEQCLRRLNSDKKTIRFVKELLNALINFDAELSVKHIINKLGYENAERYFKLKVYLDVENSKNFENSLAILFQIRDNNECVFIEDMAIGGKDLIDVGISANKNMGEVLNHLFEMVLNDEIPNEKDALISAALEYKKIS